MTFFPGMYHAGSIGAAQSQAADAEGRAARSGARASKAERDVKHLEDHLDKLTLVCLAMWSLIQEKTGLTEEDLVERVTEIDLADGEADGKVTRRIAKCPKCDRMMAARHKRCMYCGHEKLDVTAFDATL